MNFVKVKETFVFTAIALFFFSNNIIFSSIFSYGFAENQGPRPYMEDSHKIVITKDYECYGVFDGHGVGNGKLVADYVAQNLHSELSNLIKSCEDISLGDKTTKLLEYAFDNTNKKLQKKDFSKNNGCTAVIAFVQKYAKSNQLYIAYVGDSRAVISKNCKAIALTEDHKPNREDEKARIEALGGQVIHYGCWRVNGNLAVSRAFGDFSLYPYVIAKPEIKKVVLDEQVEFLILACDGVWDVLSNQEAVDIARAELSKSGDCNKAAKTLVDKALIKGSTDNITVMLVCFKDLPKNLSNDK